MPVVIVRYYSWTVRLLNKEHSSFYYYCRLQNKCCLYNSAQFSYPNACMKLIYVSGFGMQDCLCCVCSKGDWTEI